MNRRLSLFCAATGSIAAFLYWVMEVLHPGYLHLSVAIIWTLLAILWWYSYLDNRKR